MIGVFACSSGCENEVDGGWEAEFAVFIVIVVLAGELSERASGCRELPGREICLEEGSVEVDGFTPSWHESTLEGRDANRTLEGR